MENNQIAKMGLSGALAIAAALAMGFEGKRNITYLDPPGIQTICYGHTGKDVHLGQKKDDQECFMLLKDDLLHANIIINEYVKVPLSQNQRAAFVDFVFNAGEGNFSRSTLLKILNSGDYSGACGELNRWVYAAGRKLESLVRRRKAESDLCFGKTDANIH